MVLQEEAVYGLTEVYREQVKSARLVRPLPPALPAVTGDALTPGVGVCAARWPTRGATLRPCSCLSSPSSR